MWERENDRIHTQARECSEREGGASQHKAVHSFVHDWVLGIRNTSYFVLLFLSSYSTHTHIHSATTNLNCRLHLVSLLLFFSLVSLPKVKTNQIQWYDSLCLALKVISVLGVQTHERTKTWSRSPLKLIQAKKRRRIPNHSMCKMYMMRTHHRFSVMKKTGRKMKFNGKTHSKQSKCVWNQKHRIVHTANVAHSHTQFQRSVYKMITIIVIFQQKSFKV